MNVLVALVLTVLQPAAAQTGPKNCLGGICIGEPPPFMKGHVEIVGKRFEVEIETCQGKSTEDLRLAYVLANQDMREW